MGSHLNVNSVFVIAPTRYLLGVILRDVGFLKGEAGFDVFVGRRTMTELRCRFSDDMTLHGLAPSTQKVYLNAFEQLAAHYHRSPDQLTEQELRDYFTYLVKKRRIAQSTLKTYIFAIKLLYTKTLQKPWPTLKLLRPRTEVKLPVVLDPDEAKRLLAVECAPVARMCATVMYSCGLRISEALNLKVNDIDSQRMVLMVRRGKGNKDRQVPLPTRTLQLLRDYWRQYRPQTWLFVGPDDGPLAADSVRYFLKKACKKAKISKRVCTHTLRHSYATNLMARGVDVRVIQVLLGHRSLKTTTVYLHLTSSVMRPVQKTINELMADL
jgi:integrase/recombinase XerD